MFARARSLQVRLKICLLSVVDVLATGPSISEKPLLAGMQFHFCQRVGPVVQPGMPVNGAEERPVRKALPEEPEGRGSESRPVHHYQITLGWVQITPPGDGYLNLQFMGHPDLFGPASLSIKINSST